MHTTHKTYIASRTSAAKKSSYLNVKHTVQKRLHQMKASWWDRKPKELQEAADKHNIKQFYEGLWAVYGPRSSGSLPIHTTDGETLLTDKSDTGSSYSSTLSSLLTCVLQHHLHCFPMFSNTIFIASPWAPTPSSCFLVFNTTLRSSPCHSTPCLLLPHGPCHLSSPLHHVLQSHPILAFLEPPKQLQCLQKS